MQSEWRLSFHRLLQGEEDGAILGLASHLARDGLEQAARFAPTEALFELPSRRSPVLSSAISMRFASGWRWGQSTHRGSGSDRQYAPVALTSGPGSPLWPGPPPCIDGPSPCCFATMPMAVPGGYGMAIAGCWPGRGSGCRRSWMRPLSAMALCSMRPSCRRFSRSASHDRPRACFPAHRNAPGPGPWPLALPGVDGREVPVGNPATHPSGRFSIRRPPTTPALRGCRRSSKTTSRPPGLSWVGRGLDMRGIASGTGSWPNSWPSAALSIRRRDMEARRHSDRHAAAWRS